MGLQYLHILDKYKCPREALVHADLHLEQNMSVFDAEAPISLRP